MDKYKTISAFNKWFSTIKFNQLPFSIREKIAQADKYHKKFRFEQFLKVFLYGIDGDRESLREIDTAFVSQDLQQTMALEAISHSQLSRELAQMDSEILWAIFAQLVEKSRAKAPATKRNALYLVDSSTFSLNTTRYPWAEFRQTKAGVKLHLKLCFMDKNHFYPDQLEITNAVEHDDNHLEVFVNQPEATYIFDRGYIDYERLDEREANGYFFVTRIKKNTKIHVRETYDTSQSKNVLSDQMVVLGSQVYLTSPFRLVTLQDKKGKFLRFVTNRFDVTAQEVADMYKARWQIELFFKHIKQHMTVKTLFSREQGVTNQILLAMIASLLTSLVKVATGSKKSPFQIKRLLKHLLFQPFEEWLALLTPT
ncbi:MAG: IS4 family transposase [Staphylococcus equorum]|uniref:IS4 family transposase n=1 Tax=Tetragenococcus koreensis TaxID=290335 RepID=UPI001F2CFC6F|nr:IS4 family transposase [Tetragenococcus koreensis]MDN6571571.1 IS4 family transposase [Staphylococcus equorum]MCF1615228.1 IS4 family transposase [Tetragenococcus koreensis]MCF1625016.1 IS4 family transposase [Tetragenococcus koreensis]MCF1627733.1 IS4 family transposase [Tetragenococcus koreensis]MCF1678168.1 IS4 family transposase [Tetragenococcus koreensis]